MLKNSWVNRAVYRLARKYEDDDWQLSVNCTALNASMAAFKSSVVCAAMTEIRNRPVPSGTVGGRIAGA